MNSSTTPGGKRASRKAHPCNGESGVVHDALCVASGHGRHQRLLSRWSCAAVRRPLPPGGIELTPRVVSRSTTPGGKSQHHPGSKFGGSKEAFDIVHGAKKSERGKRSSWMELKRAGEARGPSAWS